MKTMLRFLLPVLVVLALIAIQVQPALAAGEPPPPGGEPPAKHNSPSDVVHPPTTPPDQVVKAVEAVYQADAMLIDSHGNPVSMASRLAVGILAGSRVLACPPAAAPVWNGGSEAGCHIYTTITEAINNATTLPNWKVWVEQANYAETVTVNKSISVIGEIASNTSISGNVTLAAANTTLMEFTINGEVKATGQSGYIHLQDLIIKNPGAPGIEIIGQKGNIVLNNVVSSGNSLGANLQALGSGTVTVINSVFNDSTVDWGLNIKAAGKIRIENVVASGNTLSNGALITSGGGAVTVSNAIFEGNGTALPHDSTSGNGLEITMFGTRGPAVTLANVMADENKTNGVKVIGAASVAVNSSAFQSNQKLGLDVEWTKGAVTLNGVYAANNVQEGAWISNPFNSAVTVTNSEFDYNGYGLEIDANGGPVTLKNNLALSNDKDGFYLTGHNIASSISISKTVSGMNTDGWGFYIQTRGAVTLNNVTAFDNGSSGLYLDNCYYDAANKCTGVGTFTMGNSLGLNEFSGNTGLGLDINTGGAVSITGLNAVGNDMTGVGINYLGEYTSAGSVSITNSDLGYNLEDGLAVETNGTVTLNKVIAYNNSGTGAWMGDVMHPKTVTITASEFNFNAADGLDVHAFGVINADHLIASTNHADGAFLFSGTGAVNLTSKTGSNQFWNNNGYGLGVIAKGGIMLKDTVANLNKLGAIWLDNCWMDAGACNNLSPSAVKLSNVFMDTNQIDSSSNVVLSVKSAGAVSLDKVFVYDTVGGVTFPGWALQVDNSGAVSGTPSVTITNSEFSFGYNTGGMQVHSLGNITLNHVSSSNNYGSSTSNAVGELNNCAAIPGGKCRGVGSISILNTLGNNAFDSNIDQNLSLVSAGSITLNGVSASYSKGHGAVLDNTAALKANPVTITNSQFNYNGGIGLQVNSVGTITLNNVEIDINGIAGARLINSAYSPTAAKPGVTITSSQFNRNGYGLAVFSDGNIAIDNITASDNKSIGAILNTCSANGDAPVCSGVGSVNITNKLGDNRFLNNGYGGLQVMSAKSISLNGVMASSNGADGGVLLDTCIWNPTSLKCLGVGDVSVSQSLFSGNTGNGLTVKSSGKITLTKVDASGNRLIGAELANQFTSVATHPVTITSSIFDNNQGNGLDLKTWSNLTLNNVSASGNHGAYGARLDTCDSATPTCSGSGSVTILSKLGPNAFNNNDGTGLYIASKGAVSMDRVSVANNGIVHNMNGAEIRIGAQATPPGVFISCSLFTGSGLYGLDVVSEGTLTLKGTLVAGNLGGDLKFENLDPITNLIRKWDYCGY
jgi:hypothetical protein